jgi:hypothetical protein
MNQNYDNEQPEDEENIEEETKEGIEEGADIEI